MYGLRLPLTRASHEYANDLYASSAGRFQKREKGARSARPMGVFFLSTTGLKAEDADETHLG